MATGDLYCEHIYLDRTSKVLQIAPATTGAFYFFFNRSQYALSGFRYLAPSPTSTANLEALSPPK
jgi:uncharacterized integral membrane protein